MVEFSRIRLVLLLGSLILLLSTSFHTAQAQNRTLFSNDRNTLALWEFDGNAEDLSGNGRDGILLGGTFEQTPLGAGLRVGESDPTGLDWSEYAPLIQYPYTVEMVLFPEDTQTWRKLFSGNDDEDRGWYYIEGGVVIYPNPILGLDTIADREWNYLAFVATDPEHVDIFLDGQLLGNSLAEVDIPPPDAIFFRDDTATGRTEQLQGVVEALRISDVARDPADITLMQDRLVNGDTAEPYRPITASIPTPQEVVFTPEVVGTNIGLAMFLAIGFGLVSTVFNSTVKENGEVMQAGFRRRLDPVLRHVPENIRSFHIPERWTRHRGVTLALFALSALIYAFLDPTFGLNLNGVLLYLSLLLSLLIVSYTYDVTQGRLAARYFRRGGHLQAFPSALLIALGCVALSRLFHFQPGYLMGFAAAYILTAAPDAEPERIERQNGQLVLAGAALLLLTALVSWLLTGLTAGIPLIHATLAILFVAGLEGVLFVLIPLDFMDGRMVFRWSKVAWFVAFLIALYWYCQILLNPQSSYLGAFEQSNVQLVLVTLTLYALLTGAMWGYFRWRAGQSGEGRAERGETAGTTGAAGTAGTAGNSRSEETAGTD